MKISARTAYDCDPVLTDSQVLDFCRTGFIMLEGVVPTEINLRTVGFLEEHPQGEPTAIFAEEWFVDNVILDAQTTGIVRSLLGSGFGLPILISNHRVQCPMGAQNWHHDGDSNFGPEVHYLQVFYYPQDTPMELGPTEVLPGSHLSQTQRGIDDQCGLLTAAPAGSVFVTAYPILHRRSRSTASATRNMLKYSYWRLTPPDRDWIAEADFDFHGADYGGHGSARSIAQMFFWLCGKEDALRTIGGQAWPYSGSRENQVDKPYGFPGF